MPDINALFLKLIEDKEAMYVAQKLGHKTTSIVERWEREKNVPDAKRWKVYALLKDEGMLSTGKDS